MIANATLVFGLGLDFGLQRTFIAPAFIRHSGHVRFEPILIGCFSSFASWHGKVLIEMQDEDLGLKRSPG